MNTVKMFSKHGHGASNVMGRQVVAASVWGRAGYKMRTTIKEVPKKKDDKDEKMQWPRKVFSGIQPTGSLHLGNYLGAVQKWTQLQNARDDVTYCIVDLHSITVPQDPFTLRENIFQMAATLLACGINPDTSTVFVQSAVKEHGELGWILGCMTTMARLGHLPQYKEKTRSLKEIPLGLFVYPVLQAADIMLYKTTHVPVGEDQVQHIQLAQHLAKTFNTKYGQTFPICHAVIENAQASRIRSLRDPNKKMSKSDVDPKATINIMDEPELIVEKIKKAVTDFQSDVSYHPERRAGVSNLIGIHSLVTGKTIDAIVEEARSVDTGKYKLRVADAVVEHLRPIRTKVLDQLHRRNELIYMLEAGAEKARQVAGQTMAEVRQKTGLGAQYVHPYLELKEEDAKTVSHTMTAAEKRKEHPSSVATKLSRPTSGSSTVAAGSASSSSGRPDMPAVPKQELRIEKKMKKQFDINAKAPGTPLGDMAAAGVNASEQVAAPLMPMSNVAAAAAATVAATLAAEREALDDDDDDDDGCQRVESNNSNNKSSLKLDQDETKLSIKELAVEENAKEIKI